MSTHIMMFNLPDEEIELRNAMNAGKMSAALWDITQHIRKRIKYGELHHEAEVELEQLKKLMTDIGVYELLDEG